MTLPKFKRGLPESVTEGTNGANQSLKTGFDYVDENTLLGTGTKAKSSIEPPGWQPNSGFARGHLLARVLGGSGNLPQNLVTMLQNPTNAPAMASVEAQIANAVAAGEVVDVGVVPVYGGMGSRPVGMIIKAHGSKMVDPLDITTYIPSP
jgi:hypothetical protein